MIDDIEVLFDKNDLFLTPPMVLLANVRFVNDFWVFIISDGKHHCQAVYEGSNFDMVNKVKNVKCKIILIEFYVKILDQDEVIAIHVFDLPNSVEISDNQTKKDGGSRKNRVFCLESPEMNNFLPISCLEIQSVNWKIRGKIIKKTFINNSSEKTLICRVSDGKTIILALFFKNLAEIYNKTLVKRKFYFISNASLQISNDNNNIKNYSPLKIVIRPDSIIKEDFEGSSSKNFLSISQIQSQRPNEIFDTCGIIQKVGEIQKINSKCKKIYKKRKITLIDQSQVPLEINL